MGNPRAARAVGNALHSNPSLNLTKCYRVVHKDGTLSNGFAFGGIGKQAELLMGEGVEIDLQRNKVMNMGKYLMDWEM